MNNKNYDRVLQKMKQISSLNFSCQLPIKIEIQIVENSPSWPLPDADVKHKFLFGKYDPVLKGYDNETVEVEHTLVADGKVVFEAIYSYDKDSDNLHVVGIGYSTGYTCCYSLAVEDLDIINKYMLFDNDSLVDIDKILEILDLKIIEMI